MADYVETPAADVSPYLKQVRVRDYPPLRDAEVNFKPGLNIIIGPNGVGKTRFLSLARHLIDLNQVHIDGAGSTVSIQGTEEARITFKKPNIFTPSQREPFHFIDAPEQLIVRAEVNGEFGEADTLAHALWPYEPLLFLTYYPILINHGIPASGLPIIDENADWNLTGRKVSADLKIGQKFIYEIEGYFIQRLFYNIFTNVRGHFPEQQPANSYSADWVKDRVKLIAEAYTDRFNQYLPLYSPIKAVRFCETLQVYYVADQDEYTIKGLSLEYFINSQWLPFSKLSDGTKRIFYIITELCSPAILVQAQKGQSIKWHDGRKIIMLEEPELGIHPYQLTRLLNLIKEVARENQIIMTTHAPQVLDMLGADELDRITVCSLDPEKGTQFHKLTEEKQEQARVYMKEVGFLSDYWRYSYLEETQAE